MQVVPRRQTASVPSGPAGQAGQSSRALEWLWPQLRDVTNPHILDCGRGRPSAMQALLARGAKVYIADLVALLHSGGFESLWDRSDKVPVFRLAELLRRFPLIPDGSLAAIFGWQLFDLVPRTAQAELFERLMQYLAPGGILFCLVREPYLPSGADNDWWLESLTTLGKNGPGKAPFPYPPITNRQMESLAPPGNIKTFLTRAGLREVVVLK